MIEDFSKISLNSKDHEFSLQPFTTLPVCYILTSSGIEYFRDKSDILKKVRDHNGHERIGIVVSKVNPSLCQKLVYNAYVSEIILSSPTMLNYIHHLFDFSKMLIYSILYHKLTKTLADIIFMDPIIRKTPFFRKTSDLYDKLFSINLNTVTDFFNKNQTLLNTYRRDVLTIVLNIIEAKHTWSETDYTMITKSLPKFIASINLRIWYLYYLISKSSVSKITLDTIANIIFSNLNSIRMASVLPYLLSEIFKFSETTHYQYLGEKYTGYVNNKNLKEFLQDSQFQKTLMSYALNNSELMNLVISFIYKTNKVTHNSTSLQVEFLIRNFGIVSNKIEKSFNQKKYFPTKNLTLADFFIEDDEDNVDLGISYLAYMKSLCDELGVKFVASLFPDYRKKRTDTNIKLRL